MGQKKNGSNGFVRGALIGVRQAPAPKGQKPSATLDTEQLERVSHMTAHTHTPHTRTHETACYIRMQTCRHARIQARTNACKHTHARTHADMHATHAHACMHACTHAQVYVKTIARWIQLCGMAVRQDDVNHGLSNTRLFLSPITTTIFFPYSGTDIAATCCPSL